MLNLDFLDNLTDEQNQVFVDKATAYFFAVLEMDNMSEKEKSIIHLMDIKYPVEEVINNPYICADYHGFCSAIKMFFPKLRIFFETECDLYFELLEFKNPDIAKEMKTDD